VEAKVADFDIRGAIKLLSSDDSLASFNEDVAEEFKKKHPSPSRELFFPDAFKPRDFSLIVNEQNVREAINSFPARSSPHICKCNAKVDEIGIHGLSCSKNSGRFFRPTEINFTINRSLTSIDVNSTLEPNGLSRNDGKRPDGMTLVPWIKGQPLVWDVTIVDTLADSYVLKTSEVSGFAAKMACKCKLSKYSSIISSDF
jgi:hypothetical protein